MSDAVNTESLKKVVRYLRRATTRALAGRDCKGIEVPPDEAAGRLAKCWLHPAAGEDLKPVLFEIHGGGFALGDARKEDALCEWVRDVFDVHVVGIDYRLSPEYAFPAALEDVLATMAYFASSDSPVAVDPNKFYLLGYSAGADLALASAFASADQKDYQLAGTALHYPFLDAATEPVEGQARVIDLPYEMMVAFNAWYADGVDAKNPLISPLFATDEQLAALPPVAMRPVVGDVLFAQAEAFRTRLEAAGGTCFWHPVEGVYHGFIEDAADVQTYEAISMAATVAARPTNYVQAAGEELRGSLEDVLGMAPRNVPFPGLEA